MNNLKKDKTRWLELALQRNPEILELQERIRPLDRSIAFGRLYNPEIARNERESDSQVLLSLIVEHLKFCGLAGTVSVLQREGCSQANEQSHQNESIQAT
mmetsp:Transcript_8121/g.12341  ORF Transcript_8121/g.12341 Transcript_8121/m.12341 type:complete len:100 (-) Transcript_8121:524-823(-)